ncbi:hypothetical protein [Geitlerinema calcuttense]|uniref:hypothetical protein n=1 Tax=Geitlerinema calcuttense TaxID=1471433 RepID=UPI003D812771
MAYTTCKVPAGEKISIQNGNLTVPDQPIIPFIRGDGTGPDIWAASERVMDAAVQKAYGGKKKSLGWRFLQGKSLLNASIAGCQMTRWRLLRNFSWASKAP